MAQPPTNQPPANDPASVPDSELSKLSPDARATVQNALKASAQASLSKVSAAEFSRGWVFSRSRPKPEAQHEEQILQNATSMDQATFAKFAANLAALKTKTGGTGGGSSSG